ncbi:MAG: hypothetical protein KJO82_07870, partial [Gammaproteobacteria bacterium]|nr:hypothetical protein [Gammaproteobacteria bacterium]
MIHTESDPQECRKLWDRFSPQQGAWDDWDLMFAFHDQDKHRLNFLVHENNDGDADGLIPLVHDTTKDRYMLMGGSYPDGRILWVRNEDFPEFFEQFPERTVLFELEGQGVTNLLQDCPQFEANFAEEDIRYRLVPPDFGFDFNQHLESFSPDKKQKFLYDLRNIRKREPILHWGDDNEADLFIDLVNKNFGAESDYADADNAKELRRVIDELHHSGRLKT